jgi:phosphoglycolate phosphatase-like HAD superfamily hydrolase
MTDQTPRTVLVDIDDTLSDTQNPMLAYVNSKSSQPYTFDKMTREHREAGIPEYENLVQEFLARPDLVSKCPPFSDALDAMRRLHEAGYEIHIVSSRKEPLHAITETWLAEHGFADYVHQIHPRSSTQKGKEFKRIVAERIKPVAGFDDTLEVAEVLAEAGFPIYLIDKPWNTGDSLPQNITRADSFAAAVNDLLSKG